MLNDEKKKISCCEGVRSILNLTKRLFSFRERTSSEKLWLRILKNKTLICHLGWSIIKLAQWFLGSASWLRETPMKCDDKIAQTKAGNEKELNCLQYDYDEEIQK